MIRGPLLFVRGQFWYESLFTLVLTNTFMSVKMHAYLHHPISRPTEGAGHSRPETSVKNISLYFNPVTNANIAAHY